MKSAKKIIAISAEGRFDAATEELAFLPAALEIVETPPSPTGRAIGATIIALFCLALIWAILGTVDIVASAPGKIIPSGRTKVIQPFETGVVRAIHVRDGQSVKAGDVLIELDPTMNEAEVDHLKSDLIAARARCCAAARGAGGRANPLEDFRPPEGRQPGADRDAAPIPDQPDARAAGQARRARSAAGAKGGRARHHCGHYRQARGVNSGACANALMFANTSTTRN